MYYRLRYGSREPREESGEPNRRFANGAKHNAIVAHRIS
jgi:hypothetical protein